MVIDVKCTIVTSGTMYYKLILWINTNNNNAFMYIIVMLFFLLILLVLCNMLQWLMAFMVSS